MHDQHFESQKVFLWRIRGYALAFKNKDYHTMNSIKVSNTLWAYARLARLDKPIGIYLVLWPAMWSLWIAAEGIPDVKLLIIFILGSAVMRSAGCVINDFADRKLDGKVRRTKQRPLITGEATPQGALALFACLCFVAFVLVLFTNAKTILLALVALGLAACYPFMKRYTHLPQIFLGAAFAWSIPMAFAAQINTVPAGAWVIFIAVLLWTVCYDTFYAMVDRSDDRKAGIKSTAVLFGDMDRVMTGTLQGLTVLALILVGTRFELRWPFYLSLFVAGALFAYQQWLIRFRIRVACFKAFQNNNWVGIAIFLGIVANYALSPPVS